MKPENVFKNLLASNPEFARFMQTVQGKTPEQVAKEYGVDLENLKSMFK